MRIQIGQEQEHLQPPRLAAVPIARGRLPSAVPPGRPATRRPQPPPLRPAAWPHVPARPPDPALPAIASLRGSAASGLAAPTSTTMRFDGCTKETRHPGCNQAERAEPSTPACHNPEAELS